MLAAITRAGLAAEFETLKIACAKAGRVSTASAFFNGYASAIRCTEEQFKAFCSREAPGGRKSGQESKVSSLRQWTFAAACWPPAHGLVQAKDLISSADGQLKAVIEATIRAESDLSKFPVDGRGRVSNSRHGCLPGRTQRLHGFKTLY